MHSAVKSPNPHGDRDNGPAGGRDGGNAPGPNPRFPAPTRAVPKIQRSNAKHDKSDTITEVKEYEGFAHLLPAQDGWEQIADEALEWAVRHAAQASAV